MDYNQQGIGRAMNDAQARDALDKANDLEIVIRSMQKRLDDLEAAYAGLIAMSLSDGEKTALKDIAKHS